MRKTQQALKGKVPTKPRSPRPRRTTALSRLASLVASLWSGAPTEPEAVPKAVKPKAVKPKAVAPRPRARQPRQPRGAAMHWTPEEDAALIQAVSENRGVPDKRSLNGIRWADIIRRAPAEYPQLMRHLTSRGSKTLPKRYCQYLNPDDQTNKARIWR